MTDDSWMRPALDALVDLVDDATARRGLSDPATLADIRSQIERDQAISVPAGERGDNLLTALLALRVKFPPDQARAKLETNLAMRRQSPPPVGAAS